MYAMGYLNLDKRMLLIHQVSVHLYLEVRALRCFWKGLLLFKRFYQVEASLCLASRNLMSGFIIGRMVVKDKQYLVLCPRVKENLHLTFIYSLHNIPLHWSLSISALILIYHWLSHANKC